MPPKKQTPSIMSRVSRGSFSKLGKIFKKKETFTSSVPPEKKEESRSPKDVKEDEQKHQTDEASKEKKEQADEVDHSSKPREIQADFKPKPLPTNKLKGVQEATQLEEELEIQQEAKGNYAVLLAHEDNELPYRITYGDRSTYTPNAISIFEKLHQSHILLSQNLKFLDKNVGYMPQFVNLGYAVMYYIRILQVRDIFGMNTYSEDKFYRAFSRQFNLMSIPIAGFLEPDFAAISFYEAKDSRLRYLVPQLEAMFTPVAQPIPDVGEQRYTYTINQESALFQPDVPMLYETCKILSSTSNTLRLDDVRVVNGVFVPRQGNAGANFRLGGHQFRGQADNHPGHTYVERLSSPGMSHRPTDNIERLIYARYPLQNTGFESRGPNFAGNSAFATIGDFLRMPSNNWDWFSTCIDALTTHASMFNGLTHAANIPTRGSLEVAHYENIQANPTHANAPTIRHADGTVPWYPNLLRTYHGQITSFEPGVEDYHFKMARHSAPNAAFTTRYSSVSTDNVPVTTNHVVNTYHNPAAAVDLEQNPVPARFGPYWGTHPTGGQLDHRVLGARRLTRSDIQFFDRRDLYVRQFYVQDGKSYEW